MFTQEQSDFLLDWLYDTISKNKTYDQAYCQGLGRMQIHLSQEAVQDFNVLNKTVYADRTGAISDQEVAEWQNSYNELKKINFDESRKKCKIVETNSEPPYGEW